MTNMVESSNSSELTHYGIKGMHWGIRRYDYVPKGGNSRKNTKSGTRDSFAVRLVKRHPNATRRMYNASKKAQAATNSNSEAVKIAKRHPLATVLGAYAGGFGATAAISKAGTLDHMVNALMSGRIGTYLGLMVGSTLVSMAAARGAAYLTSQTAEKVSNIRKNGISDETKKKLAIGAGITVAAAGGGIAYKNIAAQRALIKSGTALTGNILKYVKPNGFTILEETIV